MNALANPEVGKFINEHFCASFQKVATFKIVGNAKQGGNVAAYFCAPDGRVLHVVAGPTDGGTMLREAQWVIDATKKAIAASKGDGAKFKAALRQAHAEKLRQDYGLVVEAVTVDIAEQDPNSALSYNDPSGRPLAPKLPPPPIDGPDVTIKLAKAAEGLQRADAVRDRAGKAWVLPTGGRVHQLLAAHSLGKIETVYGTVFENILGEKVSTKPVEVATPFPWVGKDGKR